MESTVEQTHQEPSSALRLVPYLLVLTTVAIFLPVIGYGFNNHDDPGYVRDNLVIENGVTVEAISRVFREPFVQSWFPVSVLSHAMDIQLYGLQAGGHHATNLLLHVMNTLLVYFVLRRATGHGWPSAAVALLFAVHPVHVETVVWISNRKDLLAAFFLLTTVWAHLRFCDERKWRWYAFSVVLFTVGMLSKSTIVTLPCALMLLEFWPLKRIVDWKTFVRSAQEKIPFLGIGAAIVAINVRMMAQTLEGSAYRPLGMRMLNAMSAYGEYLRMTIWPYGLSPYYAYPYHWGASEAAISGSIFATCSLAAVLLIRSRPYMFTGWFWFAGTLVPVIGLIQYSDHLLADHYLYVPHIGLFVAVTWLVRDLSIVRRSNVMRALSSLVVAVVMVLFTTQSVALVRAWQHPSALYAQGIERSGPSAVGYMLFGGALLAEGELSEATAAYETAIELSPRLVPALSDLGMLYGMNGRWIEAERVLANALSIDPSFTAAETNLGIVRQEIAAASASVEAFERSASQPDAAPADRLELAAIYEGLERYTEAAELLIDLTNDTAQEGLLIRAGVLYARAESYSEAIGIFQYLVSANPGDVFARYNLANAYHRSGDAVRAGDTVREVLAMDPDFEPAIELESKLKRMR